MKNGTFLQTKMRREDEKNRLSGYRDPQYKKNIPSNTRARSSAFERRFFSWKIHAPNRKLTTTLPRRIMDTTETMAKGSVSAFSYQ